jgi:hypothetical protein
MLNSDDIAQSDVIGEMRHLLAISWAINWHSPNAANDADSLRILEVSYAH